MVATAYDFAAAMSVHQTDYNAAYAALGGKLTELMTAKTAIDQSIASLLQLVVRAETAAGNGGGTGGTGGSGGGTPSANASLALLKAALTVAPATYQAIPAGSTITVQQGAPGELPVYPNGVGAPVLHYFAPPANNAAFKGPSGTADILTVGKFAAPETFSFAYGGESRWSQNNGANVLARMWCQEIGAHVGGITTNGQYLSFMTRFAGKDSTITIDGVLQPTIVVDQSDCWTTINMGSRATRNIIFNSGGNEFGGFAVPAGDTIVPYDHLAGHFRYNALHDSWGQRRDFDARNIRMPDLMALVFGAHSVGGSVRGGTGYLIGDIPATDAQRRADINAGSPHVVADYMMVNDGDPQTTAGLQAAVRTVMTRIRTDNPNAVFVKVCWTSQGSRSTNVGGETRKRDLMKSEWDLIGGPKIFIDCLTGTWYADNGVGSGVKTRAGLLGPMITGEGSAESPTGSGNADTWIDNNGGRHPTSIGTVGIVNYIRARLYEAVLAIA